MSKKSAGDFFKTIVANFPVLRRKLARDDDWAHGQATTFAEFANDCIRHADFDSAIRAIALAESMHAEGDESIRSAMQCDFFEVLNLRSQNGTKVYARMSPEAQKIYRNAQAYIGTPYEPGAGA